MDSSHRKRHGTVLGQHGNKVSRKDLPGGLSDAASAAHAQQQDQQHGGSAGLPGSIEFVQEFTKELLPEQGAASTIDTKLKNKVVMLDNPGGSSKKLGDIFKSESSSTKISGTTNTKKGKTRMQNFSRSQQRAIGLSRMVTAKGCEFQDFVPLHHLWQQYLDEVLGTHVGLSAAEKCSKVDYHGAFLKVIQSRSPSYIGTEGLVLQETENTFRMIGRDSKLRTIPKAHSVFAFRHGSKLVTVYGNHICFRASERAVRKFKAMPTIEL